MSTFKPDKAAHKKKTKKTPNILLHPIAWMHIYSKVHKREIHLIDTA